MVSASSRSTLNYVSTQKCRRWRGCDRMQPPKQRSGYQVVIGLDLRRQRCGGVDA